MPHEARCYCAECAKLDRMRLQGIPGTYQMRLDAVPAVTAQQAALAEPEPEQRPFVSVDSLPLFGGLEPSFL